MEDRPGEVGRLKSSFSNMETKESFDAHIEGYLQYWRIPRETVRNYFKPREEFTDAEEEELSRANWIKNRKTRLKSLQNRLEAYKKEHPDDNDGISELLANVRERLAKVIETWDAKRTIN